MEELITRDSAYNDFKLLRGNNRDLYWYCNRTRDLQRLAPGITALSNAPIYSYPCINLPFDGLAPIQPDTKLSIINNRPT